MSEMIIHLFDHYEISFFLFLPLLSTFILVGAALEDDNVPVAST